MTPATIGIVGGMSPESTITYYDHIVHLHQERCGDHRYPRVVIVSVSFQDYVDWQHAGDWDRIAEGIQREVDALSAAGADLAVLATNTMHKVLPRIRSSIPILSVLDAVGGQARRRECTTLGLAGTRFTMSDGFYARALEAQGFRVVLPTSSEQERIHAIIYEDLIAGRVPVEAVEEFRNITSALQARGAELVLLACTELELLTRSGRIAVPTLDSTRVHAEAAWKAAVSGPGSRSW